MSVKVMLQVGQTFEASTGGLAMRRRIDTVRVAVAETSDNLAVGWNPVGVDGMSGWVVDTTIRETRALPTDGGPHRPGTEQVEAEVKVEVAGVVSEEAGTDEEEA